MSHTWICAKCGASAYSKCPDARNVFEGDMTINLIRSLLATHVIPTSNGVEVFMNLTVYEDNESPLNYAFDFLGKNIDKIKRITCDHWWFIKHETEIEATCTCDHKHPTTCSDTFKEAKLAATKEGEHEKVYDYKDMQNNYSRYFGYIFDQLEKKCRIDKYPDGDAQNKVSDDLEYIKGQLRLLLNRWYKGEPVKHALHINKRGAKWDDPDILDITCNDLEVGREILTLLRDKMFPGLKAYDSVDAQVEPSANPIYAACELCKKEVTGKAIVVDRKLFHQKCHDRLHKEIKRRIRIKPSLISEDLANKITYRNSSFGPDYDYQQKPHINNNVRQLLHGESVWRTEVTDFQWYGPDVYEDANGKKHRHPGYCFIEIRGKMTDIEAVVAELTTLSKETNQ